MRKLVKQLFMLPRFVRVRMVSGFALMGVIPILVAVYVITNQLAPVRQAVPWICVVVLISIVLAVIGVGLMRESVMGVINVAQTAQELLARVAGGTVDAGEIVRLERLLCYMEDQLNAARRMLQAYRDGMRKETRRFRLPPLIPSQLVRARLEEETTRAQREHVPVALFTWWTAMVSADEMDDETHVPLWLQEVLRRTGQALDALGRIRPGYWVGCARGVPAVRVPELVLLMERIAVTNGAEVEVRGWGCPEETVDVSELMRGSNGEAY